jgi:RNA polymerase sigma-70 factor (ECF subfamily)
MSEDPSFRSLIRRVRAGDEQAATEVVQRYEPAIRRTVRVRLRDRRLTRLIDSMDICQSVLASFFVRAALDQYQLENPEQLLKLLATMTRNKLANTANEHYAQCRDVRRLERFRVEERDAPAPGNSPASQLAVKELLEQARSALTDDERSLLERRQQGEEWTDIAVELGGSPEALRKKLARGVQRVARRLGLEEVAGG